VFHLGDGRWWDDAGQVRRNSKGRPLKLAPLERLLVGKVIETTRVYLACAHLDHDPGNKDPKNLKALCQRCHILHDRTEHPRQRWFTYYAKRASGGLFLSSYPVRL